MKVTEEIKKTAASHEATNANLNEVIYLLSSIEMLEDDAIAMIEGWSEAVSSMARALAKERHLCDLYREEANKAKTHIEAIRSVVNLKVNY